MKTYRAAQILLFGLLLLTISIAFSVPAAAQIGISVRIGPPALPVYEQPICPGPGYMWTPGYWSWSDDNGYYWVPGTWVQAPEPGLLWTPGYWGWHDGVYAWNAGYWGPHVGFYGGINYGFGYFGAGFGGGEWRGHTFFYNSAVLHVNTTVIRNVYVNRTVIVNNNTHVAFNGGHGGIQARPTRQQESYAHERHVAPVAAQVKEQRAASQDRAMFASANHGRPAVAATAKPGEFKGRGVVAAKAAGAPYHAPKMSPKEARASAPPANHAVVNHAAANHPRGEKAANRSSNAKPAQNNAHENNAPKEAHAAKPAQAHEPTLRATAAREPAPRMAHSSPPLEKPAAQPKRETAAPRHDNAPTKEEHKGR